MVDIDGVISLFGFPGSALPVPPTGASTHAGAPAGSFHSIDGIPHFLSSTAASHLLALGSIFDLVWASGWEEKANEYLPHLLGLAEPLPFLRFERRTGAGKSMNAHWKLAAIDDYAGARSLAWIDDAFDASCHEWSIARSAPTLLVQTSPAVGLTERETNRLLDWSRQLTVQAG